MTAFSPRRPTSGDFFLSFNHILEEHNPHSVRYLDAQGIWNKNPDSLQELAAHELLHHFWLMGTETQQEVTDFLFRLFTEGNNWLLVKRFALKLTLRDEESYALSEEDLDAGLQQSYSSVCFSGLRYPFVFLLHVLSWFLAREAQILNSHRQAPSWDKNANHVKTLFQKHLHESERFLINDNAAGELDQMFSQIKKRQPLFGVILPERLAECGRITTCIEEFLKKCRTDGCPEEVYPLICEHLTPSMGIVTNTSPAFLHPCLRLLIDRNVPIESGIPYQASVILSVLSDSRSTERLLQAFDLVPIHFSKIRENILYTLGNLAEKDAVAPIIDVLNEADEVRDGAGSNHLITGQKQEALWAAGKIGLPALAALSVLQEYASHASAKLRTCLTWTLGELGKAQKAAFNGISVDIITSLLQLMKTEDRPVFEESVVALKKIGMPDFLHALYFYHIGAVSILGLKPAQKGLYELSETIHEMIRTKGQAVIAVNGDSGTGKTYFCQALKEGFGSVKSSDILYLMRDRKKDQKIFNRILGLEWLNRYIEPDFYLDDPIEKNEDDPRNYLEAFFERNRDKKLILLDGCRDKTYFQRVIDLFYFYGNLDVVVNFRASYSTRRFNLETREAALESVETHLSFLEEPVLEDTLFYKEGKILLYDLDNSVPHRLNREDIQDLFQKSRIKSWENLIRVGRFPIRPESIISRTVGLKTSEKETNPSSETQPKEDKRNIDHEERTIQVTVPSTAPSPFLLGTVNAGELKPSAVRQYAQEQLAGITEDGQLYILTFLDNRLFTIPFGPIRKFVLQNRNFYIVDQWGRLQGVSFERNTLSLFPSTPSPILCLSPLLVDQIVTGHEDGSIRIWDFKNGENRVFKGSNPVKHLMTDYFGRIYTLDSSGRLTIRQDQQPRLIQHHQKFSHVSSWGLYSADEIFILSDTGENGQSKKHGGRRESLLSILDTTKGTVTFYSLPFAAQGRQTHVLRDGRILLTVREEKIHHPVDPENDLAVLSPKGEKCRLEILDSGSFCFNDFVPLGPRIYACGPFPGGKEGFSIWASESFTLLQRGRTSLFD